MHLGFWHSHSPDYPTLPASKMAVKGRIVTQESGKGEGQG
jgi:hypothetical protein